MDFKGLSDTQVRMICAAVSACTMSGGGSTINSLRMELINQMDNHNVEPPSDSMIRALQGSAHAEFIGDETFVHVVSGFPALKAFIKDTLKDSDFLRGMESVRDALKMDPAAENIPDDVVVEYRDFMKRGRVMFAPVEDNVR